MIFQPARIVKAKSWLRLLVRDQLLGYALKILFVPSVVNTETYAQYLVEVLQFTVQRLRPL